MSYSIRRADEGILWPRAALCAAENDPESPGWCLCRQYDGEEGLYVIDGDGHARAYYNGRHARGFAKAKVAELDAGGSTGSLPVAQSVGDVGSRAESPSSPLFGGAS